MPLPVLYTLEQASLMPALPGQAALESMIFKAWLADHGAEYDAFGANVRLGQGDDPGPSYPDFVRRFTVATTQKRADLVAFRKRDVDIFEIKVNGGIAALGQVLAYKILWNDEFPAYPVRQVGIICRFATLDTVRVFLAHGVPFFLYPDLLLPDLPTRPPR